MARPGKGGNTRRTVGKKKRNDKSQRRGSRKPVPKTATKTGAKSTSKPEVESTATAKPAAKKAARPSVREAAKAAAAGSRRQSEAPRKAPRSHQVGGRRPPEPVYGEQPLERSGPTAGEVWRKREKASRELPRPESPREGVLVTRLEESLPLIAIVGRPNVGKSTLFNRLTGSRRSIVGDEPGITRDRIYGEVEWSGQRARLVDTGGIVPDDPALIPAEINRQATAALVDADVIVMVVDARTELTRPDIDLSRMLIKSGKPIFLAVNKVEGHAMEAAAENLRKLGIKKFVPISAEHGTGIGELLDDLFAALPEQVQEPETAEEEEYESLDEDGDDAEAEAPRLHRTHGEFQQHETRVSIIGRPNVGKSTLLNALTRSNRAIVSPIAGTTRDAVDEAIDYAGQRFRFVDTAGIRRKGKTELMAEKLSVVMARRHLEASDVSLLMIDASEGVTSSDATIGGYAHESGRSVVIVINKWDLVTTARTDGKPPADQEVYEEQVRHALKYLDYAPIVFISAAEKKNIHRVLAEVKRVAEIRRTRVTTGQMNRFLDTVDFQRATVPMSHRMRILYMTQAAVAPPTFVLFTDREAKLHFAFERFLENQVRAAFGFSGTPIWFKVKARSKKDKEK